MIQTDFRNYKITAQSSVPPKHREKGGPSKKS